MAGTLSRDYPNLHKWTRDMQAWASKVRHDIVALERAVERLEGRLAFQQPTQFRKPDDLRGQNLYRGGDPGDPPPPPDDDV